MTSIVVLETPRPATVIAVSSKFVAYLGESKTSVIVHPLGGDGEETEIEGHESRITAIALSGWMACSSSPDTTLVVDLRAQSASCYTAASGLGDVSCISFPFPESQDEYPVACAACTSRDVHVFDLRRKSPRCVLSGHPAPVVCCAISRPANVACSACEDGSIVLWDSSSSTPSRLSEVVLAPGIGLLSVSMGPATQAGAVIPMCVGSEDGRVFFAEVRDNEARVGQSVRLCTKAEKATAVISVMCSGQPKSGSAAAGVIAATPEFVASVTSGSGSLEIVRSFVSGESGSLVGGCSLCPDWSRPGTVLCAAGSAFESSLEVLRISPPWVSSAECPPKAGFPSINVFTPPPPKGSPLLSAMTKARPTAAPSASTTPKKAKSVAAAAPGSSDRPVMFHQKVRSSGYGGPPVTRKMFAPKLNRPKEAQAAPKAEASPAPYPIDCGPTTESVKSDEPFGKIHGGSILAIKFCGKKLLTGSSDSHGRVTHLPLEKHKGAASLLMTHAAAVTGVDGSSSGLQALTTSLDQVVKLWVTADPAAKTSKRPSLVQVLKGSPALVISKVKVEGSQQEQPFTCPISQASFFFGDKFVSIAYGSSVLVFSFLVDIESTDAQRLQNHSKYKLATQLSVPTKVTCFACNNSASSSIAIVATSDHCLNVFDVATGATIRNVQSAHDRPVHRVALLRAGAGASLPPEAHNMFVTSSVDNSVKLWDLRSVSCVRRFEGHLNRTHKIGVALSPCGKFIAQGSEDKSIAIFDISQGSLLAKLHGHSDVVSDVDYCTTSTVLASCSHDSTVRLWTPP